MLFLIYLLQYSKNVQRSDRVRLLQIVDRDKLQMRVDNSLLPTCETSQQRAKSVMRRPHDQTIPSLISLNIPETKSRNLLPASTSMTTNRGRSNLIHKYMSS